jgi:tetratricopeptide (TPR) repeat protein
MGHDQTSELGATGGIVAFRNDRLGARLISLVNAVRLSQTYDLPLEVYWNEATDIGAIFNDPREFFDTAFVDSHFSDLAAWKAVRNNTVRVNDLGPGGSTALRETLARGQHVLVDSAFDMTVLADEDPAAIRAHCSRIWQDFPFAQCLAEPLADIRRNVEGGTAYHIRRGDLISFPRAMNRSWPAKYIPDEFYMSHIEGVLAQGIRPVLFSDDAGTIARFHACYPGLVLAETLFDAASVTPGQRDLLELAAMSRCARIIAPGNSAFSSTAATLGGAEKSDVTLDIAPEQQERAKARLVERLKEGSTQPVIANQGDIGQSLNHLAAYLTAQDRIPEAAAITAGYLRGGLNISFVFPLAIKLHLLGGDPAGAVEMALIMEDCAPYHRKDFANGEILHAIAHLAKGDLDAARRHVANGYWNEPDQGLVRETIGFMLETGLLDQSNFLTASPAARHLRRRTFQNIQTNPVFAPLLAHGPDVESVPGLDPLVWDWFPFLRSGAPTNLERHPHRAGFEKSFTKRLSASDDPDTESLATLFQMHLSPNDSHLDALAALARAYPDEAMVQHRLSAGAWLTRSHKIAIAAAESAADAAPLEPAHQAWRGMTRIRSKAFRPAITDMRAGIAAGLAFPRLYQMIASTELRLGETDAASATLDQGIALAGLDTELRFARAELLRDAGQPEAALGDLAVLARNDTRSPKVLILHAECLAATGAMTQAKGLLTAALEQTPENKRLRTALAALHDQALP